MKTDAIIKQQVEKALQSNILLQDTQLEVKVQAGEVIVKGYTNRYYKKSIISKMIAEITEVNKIVLEIEIMLDDSEKYSDHEMETNIIAILKKNFSNIQKDIQISVSNGNVWLEGQLKLKYQKDLIEESIWYVPGIKEINNRIRIPEILEPVINEKDVFAAIYSDHSIISDINIEIVGHKLILKGSVESIEQKDLITKLVRNVSGVKEIDNLLSADWIC